MADKSATPPGDGFNPPQGDLSRDQLFQLVNRIKDHYDLFAMNYGKKMDEMLRLRHEQAEKHDRRHQKAVDNFIRSHENYLDLLLQETEDEEDSGFEDNFVEGSSKHDTSRNPVRQPEPDHMENHLPPPR